MKRPNRLEIENSCENLEQLKTLLEEKNSKIFRLKSVIDNLPGSIYWKDRNGVYLGRNVFSHEKSKSVNLEDDTSTQDSLIGKTDYDYFSKEVADGYRKNDLEVMETGKELVKEETVVFPDGKKLIQLSSKRPLRDEKGNITGVIGNTVDITHLKEIEAELREAKEQLEIANNIKTDFIRNMEHDIRTPLGGVWGLANYLWKHEPDAQKKAYLGDITNCAKELMDYCNGILDFSKIELGILPILEKKFNLKKVIDRIMIIETPPAGLKKLNLTLDYDNHLPTILIGDPYRLERMLLNLVSNAIKFTEKGNVILRVKLLKYAKDNKNSIVRFIIEDTGIGIPQEKQDFIYEKFYRITPSNKNIYKGIGLGLRVVRQFITEMNGEIDLKSELGKGSTFICILPFKLPLTAEVEDIIEN